MPLLKQDLQILRREIYKDVRREDYGHYWSCKFQKENVPWMEMVKEVAGSVEPTNLRLKAPLVG